MRRRIDTAEENSALDWLDEELTDKHCDSVVFALRGNLGSQCRVLDLVSEAKIRGARLSACAQYIGVHPRTLQRWSRQRRNSLYKLSGFLGRLS